MTVPDFLCIGAQKAGTTWLHAALRQHDRVFLPPIKEVHFFDFLYIPAHRNWILQAFDRRVAAFRKDPELRDYACAITRFPRMTDEWYAAIFSHPDARDRIRGEITPEYSILPQAGVEKVHALNPQMKIIFVIRDPADRVCSQLRMIAQRRNWNTVTARRLDRAGNLPAVLKRSAYRENISCWETVFPQDQFLYMPYSLIRTDPDAFMKRVEGFLGLAPHRYRHLADRVHQSRPVEIAPEIMLALERMLQGERDYLAERFGEAFVQRR